MSTSSVQKLTTNNVYDINEEHYYSQNANLIYSGSIIKKEKSEMQSQNFIDLLNGYKDESGNYPSEWKRWKLGEDGYPTFE